MNRVDIEKPIRLTRGFWICYVVLFAPVLWLIPRVLWDVPFYAKAAMVILFPFTAALVSYCTFQMVVALVTGSAAERRQVRLVLLVAFAVACGRVLLKQF